jgi:hypothetical protein
VLASLSYRSFLKKRVHLLYLRKILNIKEHRKENTSSIKGIVVSTLDDLESILKAKIRSSWPYTLIVAMICLAALWVRILPAKTVFLPNGLVKFASNDAWYHIRTLHLLLNNYPKRMFYNPMTNYPYGSYIHFGPMFDQMMAITALILGLGHPSSELVNYIVAFFPAVLGALTVVPVYHIGKHLGGRKTGILASILIAFAPGQFLARSMIGFTDHHVAEALFSTFFMMFFMLALSSAQKNNLTFEHVFQIRIFNILFVYSLSWKMNCYLMGIRSSQLQSMTGLLVLFLQSSDLFLESTPSQAFGTWSFSGYTSTKNGTILKEIRSSFLKKHRRK